MGLLVSCSIALVSTKDDISKHLFLSGEVEGGYETWQGLAGPAPSHPAPLTSSCLKGLELDGLNVVDKCRHLLGGIDLTAGCALWPPNARLVVPDVPQSPPQHPFPHLQSY